MIVLADSSPLITLARARYFELLHEFYGELIVSREVRDEITVAGAGLSGADEMQRASWIRVQPNPSESSPEVRVACAGLGAGERSIIYLASALTADLVLIDEERARRAAKTAGLTVAGSIAVLERGATLGRVDDLRSAYLSLLEQGIRYDRGLLNESLGRLGLAMLVAMDRQRKLRESAQSALFARNSRTFLMGSEFLKPTLAQMRSICG